MRLSEDLQVGKAGEYLTCFDLIMKGFVCYPSEQGLPYDLILDTGDRLLRVQVKTTREPRDVPQRKRMPGCKKSYLFYIKRCGKKGKKLYTEDEIDIFALVALDTKQVAYLKNTEMPTTLILRCDQLKGTYHDEKLFNLYDDVIKLKEKMSRIEIAKKIGVSKSTIDKILNPSYVPIPPRGKYFSELQKDKDWFLNLSK